MDIPLKSVTHGQCDARPTVTFPAAGHHHPLTGAKLYCLVTEARVCTRVYPAKMAEPQCTSTRQDSCRRPRNLVLDGLQVGANTIERSVLGDDASFQHHYYSSLLRICITVITNWLFYYSLCYPKLCKSSVQCVSMLCRQ